MCADFDKFLSEIGVTTEQMALAKAEMPVPVTCPEDIPHAVMASPIEGLGVFAVGSHSGRLAKLWDGEWNVAGRYINHSPSPNAIAVADDGAIYADGSVADGEEITLDYRQVRKVWEKGHV